KPSVPRPSTPLALGRAKPSPQRGPNPPPRPRTSLPPRRPPRRRADGPPAVPPAVAAPRCQSRRGPGSGARSAASVGRCGSRSRTSGSSSWRLASVNRWLRTMTTFTRDEVDSSYVDSDARFVVSLIVGYHADELDIGEV